MSDMIQKLENGNHPSNLDLVDYVIQLQLNKIENYNEHMAKTSSKISESTEYAMSNLIDLIELRFSIKSDDSEGNADVI